LWQLLLLGLPLLMVVAGVQAFLVFAAAAAAAAVAVAAVRRPVLYRCCH
jgi:hypothetical protein